MRINKYFTEHGVCSRREADKWIESGRIKINGRIAKLGDQVQPDDKVYIDDKLFTPPAKKPIIIAYHKPVGIECTSDPRVKNNIIEAVGFPERLVHIGRLDVMSEGLILLTNLGDIVNKILRRHFGHQKEYIVEFSEDISEAQIEKLSRGVDIGDEVGPTLPCPVEKLARKRLRIILTEGRNRQIRRMSEAVGLKVTRLKRIRVMNIELGDLKRGTYRHLTKAEMKELMSKLDSQT